MKLRSERRMAGRFTPPTLGPLPLHRRRLGRRLRVVAPRTAAPGRPRRHPARRAGSARSRSTAAAERASGADRKRWRSGPDAGRESSRRRRWADALKALALDEALVAIAARYPGPPPRARSGVDLPLVADRERARFSSWYELFPRSAGAEPGVHGTFEDVEARLPDDRGMGFDVLYLPPIHPIGRDAAQGQEQCARGRAGRRRQPVGHRRGRRRPQGHPSGARHARRLPAARGRGRARTASRSRSTSRSSARPTTLTSRRTRSGSAGGPTAACSTPRTRRRSTRTSTRSTSRRDDWQALWAELKSVFDHWIDAGRDDLPRRQPAHQGLPVLGMGHRRDQARAPGGASSWPKPSPARR